MRRFTDISVQFEKNLVWKLLFLLSGMMSCLLILGAVPGISFSPAAVFLTGNAVCIGLFVLRSRGKSWSLLGTIGVLAVCGIAVSGSFRTFSSQTAALLHALTDPSVSGKTDITLLAAVAAAVLGALLFLLEILCRHHFLLWLTVMLLFALAPFFGVEIGMPAVLTALFFQIGFWTVRTAEKGNKAAPAAEGGKTGTAGRNTIFSRGTVFMAFLLTAAVCISVVVTSFWGTSLSELAYSSEGYISRSLQQITGSSQRPKADGRVSSGNNYRTGERQLEIVLEEEPGETIYLKGFSGGEYVGGEWLPADDEPIFHRMAQQLGANLESWIRSTYDNLYLMMNVRQDREPRSLFMNYVSGEYDSLYRPYYSSWVSLQDLTRPGYGFYYFEQSEMDIRWEENSPDMMSGGSWIMSEDWYKQVQTLYMQELPAVYTDVPRERLPRLTRLCESKKLTGREEVTAFILSLLQDNAAYTLTPGRAPLNEDIVEYFLFERHEGYCVHYASAATLIYRLYGIPARYVSGYALSPSDFTRQEDGSWVADVTDESSHAWTEIFIEDYGWTPVEFTPDAAGNITADYPGLDQEQLQKLLRSGGLTANISAGDSETGKRGSNDSGSFSSAAAFAPEQYRQGILLLLKVLLAALLLSPLFLVWRRAHRRRRFEQMNCRQIFGLLMDMLHFAGRLRGLNGTEPDFAGKLADAGCGITMEEAVRLTAIVRRAAYGKEEPGAEDTGFVRQLYQRAAEQTRKEMRGLKKISFTCLRVFC